MGGSPLLQVASIDSTILDDMTMHGGQGMVVQQLHASDASWGFCFHIPNDN